MLRLWSARAAPGGVGRYQAHFHSEVLPRLRQVPGFAGARILQRRQGGQVEVLVATFWDSAAALRDFAGDDLELAVVHPAARGFLLRADSRARNYEVLQAFTP